MYTKNHMILFQYIVMLQDSFFYKGQYFCKERSNPYHFHWRHFLFKLFLCILNIIILTSIPAVMLRKQFSSKGNNSVKKGLIPTIFNCYTSSLSCSMYTKYHHPILKLWVILELCARNDFSSKGNNCVIMWPLFAPLWSPWGYNNFFLHKLWTPSL